MSLHRTTSAFSATSENFHDEPGSEDHLLAKLHALHAHDLDSLRLSQKTHKAHVTKRPFLTMVVHILYAYMIFVLDTWSKAIWSMVFYPLTIPDTLAILTMSSGASIIMAIIVTWCIFARIPVFVSAFSHWSSKATGGLSLVNASYPGIFEESSYSHSKAVRNALTHFDDEFPGYPRHPVKPKTFNLDIAKLLLQCSALMYEKTSSPTREAMMKPRNAAGMNGNIDEKNGHSNSEYLEGDEEATIRELASHLGLHYMTVSEMNTVAASFCGLFWDPESTFIIVAFKGTTPTDPEEWMSDFSFNPRNAAQWIKGFRLVHGGFLDKIFPSKISPNARMPYDTIREAIDDVATHLLVNKPEGTQIHVWVTGHSLGCSLAGLVFAKMTLDDDFGSNVAVRDAYLFAAPIICDAESASAFNHEMNRRTDRPRTLWRFTNGTDAVATMLPDQGDTPDWNFSPFNSFTFAHLGCEIKMRCAPACCIVDGNLFTKGSSIIATAIESASGSAHRPLAEHHSMMLRLQSIPLIGSLLCHAPGFYWSQLQAVACGPCSWEE